MNRRSWQCSNDLHVFDSKGSESWIFKGFFSIFICKYVLNPGFGLSQCVDWWEIFYFYFDMRGKFGDSVNVCRAQAAVSISLLLGYTGVRGWIKRVSAPYAQDLQSPSSTLQPSCNMDYYLWKSLHVVRTWVVSLSSSGADGEREHFSLSPLLLQHTYPSSYINFCL